MSKHPFITYLESYRLRTGFTRSELAFLLGALDGKNTWKHECRNRIPMLRTALAYGLILGVSVESLYEGLTDEIRDDLKDRARGLRKYIGKRRQTELNRKKIAILNTLAGDTDERATA